jgi:hypothetical protein
MSIIAAIRPRVRNIIEDSIGMSCQLPRSLQHCNADEQHRNPWNAS